MMTEIVWGILANWTMGPQMGMDQWLGKMARPTKVTWRKVLHIDKDIKKLHDVMMSIVNCILA